MSRAQWKVLDNLVEGRLADHHVRGQSAYGGFACTLLMLRQQGLLPWDGFELTEKGRQAWAEGVYERVEV